MKTFIHGSLRRLLPPASPILACIIHDVLLLIVVVVFVVVAVVVASLALAVLARGF
jgi:hypothetical protein